MSRVTVALVLSLAVAPAFAGTIPAIHANSYVGQFATVEGIVGEVKVSKSGTTFIDVGGNYPNEAFTGVVFASDASSVGDVSGLSGKKVDIGGAIQLYRGRPEIIVKSRSQIKEAP